MLHSGECIVLFSPSRQTYCALVICSSEWMTVVLHSVFGCCLGFFENMLQGGVRTVLFSFYMAGADVSAHVSSDILEVTFCNV